MSVSEHPDRVTFVAPSGSIVSGTVVESFEHENADVDKRVRGYVVSVDGVDPRFRVSHDEVVDRIE